MDPLYKFGLYLRTPDFHWIKYRNLVWSVWLRLLILTLIPMFDGKEVDYLVAHGR